MICTKCASLLNSVDGRIKLNFRPASHTPRFNPVAKNIVVVWDILMQDYRNVSMDACDIIQTIPEDKFWEYYNKTLYPMSPVDKMNLMDS